MKIKMSAAAAFYDSYSGRQIPPGVISVKTQGQVHFLIKDGYFCFLNCNEPELLLSISAKGYQETALRLTVNQESGIAYIWLQPDKTYPFEGPYTVFEGRMPGNCQRANLLLLPKKPRMRLKKSVAKGSKEIEVLSGDFHEKNGRVYCLVTKTKERELVQIREELEEGHYCLTAPLKYVHEEQEAFFPLYPIECDRTGYFYLPLGKVTEECGGLLIMEDGLEIVLTLKAGETNFYPQLSE